MKTPREKYMKDPHYYQLVNMMVNEIKQCNYTPSEMREAALLASIIYEEQKIDSRHLQPNKEIEDALKTLNDWVESPNQ